MEQQYEVLQKTEYLKFRVPAYPVAKVYPETKTGDIRMYGKSLPEYSHKFIKMPSTPSFTDIQATLDYWLNVVGYTVVKIKQRPAIWKSYFNEIKRYASEDDFEFLREISTKIKCFAPILVEIIHKIERKYKAKVELSVSRDPEIGDRVFILVGGLKFRNLEEKYEFEDELEGVVWSIIEEYKEKYDPSEVRDVNVLVSILVLEEEYDKEEV